MSVEMRGRVGAGLYVVAAMFAVAVVVLGWGLAMVAAVVVGVGGWSLRREPPAVPPASPEERAARADADWYAPPEPADAAAAWARGHELAMRSRPAGGGKAA